ncbi:uncharacterized protein LOC143317435 [Chaetodon auriga]|uniref:uncharacterized protein LOC143317435 n=1 Tax=Chaetodon auriga TaxID=39042 RepID=UPI0040329F52
MPCSSSALPLFIILILRVQSISLNHARSFSLLPFDLPEIDGSAVDICRIFSDSKPNTATTTAATTLTTTTLTTRKVVATTKKPAIQSPPRKPNTKHTDSPIRPLPAPAGSVTDSHSNPINSLLYLLLASSKQHAAGSLPGFNSLISQPIRGLPHRGYSTSSESDEFAAALLKRIGRREEKRWKMSSSEDSSDES